MCITINATSGYKEVLLVVEFKICYQNNKHNNNTRIWNNIRWTSEAFDSELKALHVTLLEKILTLASSNC